MAQPARDVLVRGVGQVLVQQAVIQGRDTTFHDLAQGFDLVIGGEAEFLPRRGTDKDVAVFVGVHGSSVALDGGIDALGPSQNPAGEVAGP